MNISFDYLYRDAGNYKLYGSVVFKNEHDVPLKYLLRAIISSLYQRMYFVPEIWEIPRLKFRDFDPDLDHWWHEFDSLSETEHPNTVGKNVTDFFRLLNRKPQYLLGPEDFIKIEKTFSK